jgi:excisionase family DNA binding protein
MEEAAKKLNVSVAVVRTMVKHGKLPARQIAKGAPWMIEPADLNRPSVLSGAKDAGNRRESPHDQNQQILIP